MKTSVYIVIFLSHLVYSQNELETSNLRLFGTKPLIFDEIKQADSLLIEAVNHYNSKSTRDHEAVNLNDSLYSEYVILKQQRNYHNQFYSKKGNLKKRKLKSEMPKKSDFVHDFLREKNQVDTRIDELESINKTMSDSIVLTWGAMGHIDLKNYIRQYQYSTNEHGTTRFIKAFCYCESMIKQIKHLLPENRLITVNDGGNCFFTLLIDLKNNAATSMKVNGFR